jgi:hypothetical protein
MPPAAWTDEELEALAALRTPSEIQAFLDSIPYSDDPFYRCPLRVWRERRAHCFDGATFAAAALARLGHEPLLVDMRAVRDDDHVIAIFRQNGHFGALAKSNFAGLRFREPIHRSLRELAMSYFEDYYNVAREKTLRAYSAPVSLRRFDREEWEIRDEVMARIAARLDRARHISLLTQTMADSLSLTDERSYAAGMLGVNEAGLYRPPDER